MSIIDKNKARKWGIRTKKGNYSLLMANGTPEEALVSEKPVKIEVGNSKCEMEMCVSNLGEKEVLLGADWCVGTEAVIDMKNKKISFESLNKFDVLRTIRCPVYWGDERDNLEDPNSEYETADEEERK